MFVTEDLSSHIPFINIHDLEALTAELARLLGVSLSQDHQFVTQA